MRKGRTMRKSKGSKGSKASRKSTRVKRSTTPKAKRTKNTKKTKKTKKTKGKKGMNKYMIEKEKARKAGKETFVYNGTTYKKATTKTGMVIYKKA